MKKFLAIVLLSVSAFAQKIASTGVAPQGSLIGKNGANYLYVNTDNLGNLETNGTGSVLAAAIASTGAPPFGTMVGYNASGNNYLYVNVDPNGNVYVNCITGCTGGTGNLPIATAVNQVPVSNGPGTVYGAKYVSNQV